MELVKHTRLAYPTDEAANLIGDIGRPKLNTLIKRHKIHTYRVGRKVFVPSFEIDRLIDELLREEKHSRFQGDSRG